MGGFFLGGWDLVWVDGYKGRSLRQRRWVFEVGDASKGRGGEQRSQGGWICSFLVGKCSLSQSRAVSESRRLPLEASLCLMSMCPRLSQQDAITPPPADSGADSPEQRPGFGAQAGWL